MLYRILIFRFAAGFGTNILSDRLPGFIGPFPPPLLIRLYAVFIYILLKKRRLSSVFVTFIYNYVIDFFWK